MKKLKYIFLFCLWQLSIFGQQQTIGLGSYNLTLPLGGYSPSNSFNQPVLPKTTKGFNKLIQTNDWWSSLIWNYETNKQFNWAMHSWPLFSHPMAFMANRYGLKITYPNQAIVHEQYGDPQGTYQYLFNVDDFNVTIKGMDLDTLIATKVKGYSDWTVTAEWDDQKGNTLDATLGLGLTYVYFTKSGGDAVLRFKTNPIIDHLIGNNIIGINVNNHYYGIFAPSGSSWNLDSSYTFDENELIAGTKNLISRKAFISSLGGENYFSIALLPDNSLATLNEYASHAFVFIDSTQVDWKYDNSRAILTSKFNYFTTIKEGKDTTTLIALYKHQWMNTSVNTSYTYISPKGEMKVLKGNSFETKLTNQGIIPHLPWIGAYDTVKLHKFIDDEQQVSNVYNVEDNSYFTPIRICRQAYLAEIAHQIGFISARERFLDEVEAQLEDWLKADDGETNSGYFYYDTLWNTLIGFNSGFYSDRQLNDHHFHYGYFIKAASILAQFRPDWASDTKWGGMVEMLIRDVAEWKRNDKLFPFLRNFDPYSGHSWASGMANNFQGNNQESSSESLNFASGVFLWGMNTHKDTIRDLGLFLFLNEVSAVEQYWFNIDKDVFPPGFNHVSSTRIWGSGSDKIAYPDTWAGTPEYIAGINFIPAFATSLYLAKNSNYVMENYNEILSRKGKELDTWQDMMWVYHSLLNPHASLLEYKAKVADPPYTTNFPFIPDVSKFYNSMYEEPISPAFLYHWLYTLDSIGTLNTDITADIASYAVFHKNNFKYYVVYNPDLARDVHFSNGIMFHIPSDTLIVYKVNATDVETLTQPLSKIMVYPNPANNQLIINNLGSRAIEISLFDNLGNTVYSSKMEEPMMIINTSSFPSGLYFLVSFSGKEINTQKIEIIR